MKDKNKEHTEEDNLHNTECDNAEYEYWSDEWDEWHDDAAEENRKAKYRKKNKRNTNW